MATIPFETSPVDTQIRGQKITDSTFWTGTVAVSTFLFLHGQLKSFQEQVVNRIWTDTVPVSDQQKFRTMEVQ